MPGPTLPTPGDPRLARLLVQCHDLGAELDAIDMTIAGFDDDQARRPLAIAARIAREAIDLLAEAAEAEAAGR
jgi:hypothetical protein